MSSNEYVPSEDELRRYFKDGMEPNVSNWDAVLDAMFDRAIAAIKAEAKVEALREFGGDYFEALDTRWEDEWSRGYKSARADAHRQADRIEREASE